jgi:ACS family hexuronate transporter-like MFS transporter
MSNKSTWRNSFLPLIVLLLVAGSMLNYLDRSVLGVVMPAVRRDLSLTNRDYGLAIHAFLLMYAVFYILGGRIADRLGYRRTFTLAIIFWSLSTMAHAFVQGLRSLFFCEALSGMGEGSYYPAAMRGAAGLFPPASRAKAVGAILSAISVGMLLAPPLVAGTTLHFGWRTTFLMIGSLGFLLVPPWLWVHRRLNRVEAKSGSAPAEQPTDAAGLPAGQEVTLGDVLRSRKYWCVLAARACGDTAWYFYIFWIPGYFQENRGLSLAWVGRLLWIPYLFSFIGALAGAAASSALIRKGWSLHRGRLACLLVSAFIAVFGASAGFAPTTRWALALVSLALFAHQSWSTNLHTVITEISPPQHIAILYGITGASGTLIGAASQLVIGPLIDLHGYKPAFVGAGALYVLAVTLLLSAGALEPIQRRLAGLSGMPSVTSATPSP